MAEQGSGNPTIIKNAHPPQFNGVHSAHSSRGQSPISQFSTIPASQLPPMKHNIPLSQLPPSRPTTTEVTQKVGQLSVSDHSTPNISPKIGVSSPQQTSTQKPYFAQNISPIPLSNVPNTFHQSQSAPVLGSVPLNSVQNINNVPPARPFSNTPQTAIGAPLGINQVPTGTQNFSNQLRSGPQSAGALSGANQVPTTTQNLSNQFRSVPQSVGAPLGINQITTTQNLSNQASNAPQRAGGAPLGTNQIPTAMQNLPSQFSQQKNWPQSNQFNGPNIQNKPFQSIGRPQIQAVPGQQPVSTSTPQNFSRITNYNNPLAPTGNLTQPINGPVGMSASAQSLQNNGPQPPSSAINYNVAPLAGNQPSSFNETPPPSVAKQAQNRTNLHANRYPTPTSTYQSQLQLNYPAQPSAAFQPQNVAPTFQQPQQQPMFQSQAPQKPVQFDQQSVSQQLHQPAQQGQGVANTGFSRYWGTENIDLLQNPNILPPTKLEAPQIYLGLDSLNEANCSPDIFRATMTKIPANNSLLQKSRLPLGVLIHPFKDLSHLPVIQCNVIVRCRACRTYINPFVYFTDSKRWKCNLCYRINELPEEFQYDPVSKTYGDPSRRPEIKASTIEYIAPAEYMLRPPQPAVYLFLFDISRLAVESGYLSVVCSILMEELANLPGDARTQIGFLAYDSALHFFSLADGLNQPHEMTVLDIDDVFLPTPDNLLVNLKDRTEMIQDLLQQLPNRYVGSFDNNSALGAALQAAYKMVGATGGRVTVFQCSLPNIGPGALASREDPNNRAAVEVAHLNPANDFYKRLALECSGQQIAVDLFILNSQYVDIATISGISRFSGGCINHFPLFKATKPLPRDGFERSLRRYLTRKIGFEAVMRVRCTRGLSIHTFHGNFFVRSTDLLSLPNVNPDTGFGMQVAIEESLADVQTVCFQAALLYTSSKGERRIRVHTLCLPVASTLHEVIHSADQQAIVGLLGKMAVDRSMQASLSDAREAFINVAIDILSSYKFSLNLASSSSGLLAPDCLRLLPLYISALLKHTAFRIGTSTRLDDRVKAMIDMKCKPLSMLIQMIYPDVYPIHNLEQQEVIINSEEEHVPMPPRLQLTARCLENRGAFLMDSGDHMIVLVCPNVSQQFLNDVLGVTDYNSITDQMFEIPVLDNPSNQRLQLFLNYLNDEKPFPATIQVLRDNSPGRVVFFERLIEDRVENALSYHEFLQHLKTQVK